MANGESAIIDPRTGWPLHRGDPDTEEARNNRLKYQEAIRLLEEGDEAGYDRLMDSLTEGAAYRGPPPCPGPEAGYAVHYDPVDFQACPRCNPERAE